VKLSLALEITLLVLAVPCSGEEAYDAQMKPPASAPDSPSPANVTDGGQVPGAWAYEVGGTCNLLNVRALGESHQFSAAWVADQVFSEEVKRHLVNGDLKAYYERRVRLRGFTRREGELVCSVGFDGKVVRAHIEREAQPGKRRALKRREGVAVTKGAIPDLGTYSLLEPFPKPDGG